MEIFPKRSFKKCFRGRSVPPKLGARSSPMLLGIVPVYLQELCRPILTLIGCKVLCSYSGQYACKHLEHAVPCILSCCTCYMEFTPFSDSVATKVLHAFVLQVAEK